MAEDTQADSIELRTDGTAVKKEYAATQINVMIEYKGRVYDLLSVEAQGRYKCKKTEESYVRL